jgi:preprotein translocase subunit SecA
MAGRGTDILLGGNPEFLAAAETNTRDPQDPAFQEALARHREACVAEHKLVVEAGGLYVMGTERHESRRIDNQLRGRAGRQGDRGESRFYISLEDDLMVRFQGERLQQLMARMGWEEGMALDNSLMSRTIESAQKRVEAMHFESRKHVTEYDDVMNKQRQVIYNLRARILRNEQIREEAYNIIDDIFESAVTAVCDEREKPIDWDLSKLSEKFAYVTGREFVFPENLPLEHQAIFDALRNQAKEIYRAHADEQSAKLVGLNEIGVSPQLNRGFVEHGAPVGFELIEQDTMLEAVDYFWRHHLQEMDYLREGIGLRGYAQKNPLYEYQREGFLLFQQMLEEMKESVLRRLFYHAVPSPQEVIAHIEEERRRHEDRERQMQLTHGSAEETEAGLEAQDVDSDDASKSPDDERSRLEAQRKARRKASKR